MRPTRVSTLVALLVLAGGAAYLVTRSSYASLPIPSRLAIAWLPILAAAEAYIALVTRARLAGRPGTRAVDPLAVARLVALAKASAVVGAVATGLWAGFLGWAARQGSDQAHADTLTAALGVGLGLALTAAALALERACRVPHSQDDDAPS